MLRSVLRLLLPLFALGVVVIPAGAMPSRTTQAEDATPQGIPPFSRYLIDSDTCPDVVDTLEGQPIIRLGKCTEGTWAIRIGAILDSDPAKVFDQFLLPGDWDKDGCSDVIGIKEGKLSLLEGNCGLDFTDITVMPGDFSEYNYFIAPGHFDNDSFPDILARRRSNADLVLFSGNGSRGFIGDPVVIGTGWHGFDIILGAATFGSGDSCPDLLGRLIENSKLMLYQGNCEGGFKVDPPVEVVGGGDLADFDWLFAGGDFAYNDGSHCPDIVGWDATDPDNLAIFAGGCNGSITLPRKIATSPTGWHYPFASDSSHATFWGDGDCSGASAPRDGQAGLRHFLDLLELSHSEPCPFIGDVVFVNGRSVHWGDWDCNGQVAPRDSQAVQAFFLELAPITQTAPCPKMGENVALNYD